MFIIIRKDQIPFQCGNRTTCAVEAKNGVLGRGIPGNANFFTFVHYMKSFELAHSIKLRNTATGLVEKVKRQSSQEKSVQIRAASKLLDSNSISVAQFLDHIAAFKDNKLNMPTKRKQPDEQSDASSSEDESESSSSQSQKRPRLDSINLCRVCDENESRMVLLPCAHAVICNDCWVAKSVVNHDAFCPECNKPVSNAVPF